MLRRRKHSSALGSCECLPIKVQNYPSAEDIGYDGPMRFPARRRGICIRLRYQAAGQGGAPCGCGVKHFTTGSLIKSARNRRLYISRFGLASGGEDSGGYE